MSLYYRTVTFPGSEVLRFALWEKRGTILAESTSTTFDSRRRRKTRDFIALSPRSRSFPETRLHLLRGFIMTLNICRKTMGVVFPPVHTFACSRKRARARERANAIERIAINRRLLIGFDRRRP